MANVDVEVVDEYLVGIRRTILHAEKVVARLYRWEQEIVSMSVGEAHTFGDKLDVAIDARHAIQKCPDTHESSRSRRECLRAKQDDDAAVPRPADIKGYARTFDIDQVYRTRAL